MAAGAARVFEERHRLYCAGLTLHLSMMRATSRAGIVSHVRPGRAIVPAAGAALVTSPRGDSPDTILVTD